MHHLSVQHGRQIKMLKKKILKAIVLINVIQLQNYRHKSVDGFEKNPGMLLQAAVSLIQFLNRATTSLLNFCCVIPPFAGFTVSP